MPEDNEAKAIAKIVEILKPIDEEQRKRVLGYAVTRFGATAQQLTPAGKQREKPPLETEYEDAPALYHAAVPTTQALRALVIGYWLQVCQQQGYFYAATVNKELNNMSNELGNITKAFTILMKRKPAALVIQAGKSGTGPKARKRYRLTTAGVATVEKMLAGNAEPEEE